MRVMLVVDNPDHRELITEHLRREWPRAEFAEGSSEEVFHALLDQGGFDVALIDYKLQWSNGLALLGQIHERYPYLPVVMVTDEASLDLAVAGMKSGLSDYVPKEHWEHLPAAVRESIEKADLRKKQDKTQDRLKLSEERYRTCSELTSDFAYSFQVEAGRFSVEWVTAAFYRITGYVPEELDLTAGWRAIVHAEDQPVIDAHYRRLLEGEPAVNEFRIKTKSGANRWIKDYSRPIRESSQGPVMRIIGAAQDYTFVRQAQDQELALGREQAGRQEAEALSEALRESEARARRVADHWTRFMKGAAKDLREPLNNLLHAAAVFEVDYTNALDDRAREYLRRITEYASRMHLLLDGWPDTKKSGEENGGQQRPHPSS